MLSLISVQYYAQWDKDIIDIEGPCTDPPWDGNEEADKKIAKARRTAYSVVRMRVSKALQYLLDDIRPGDVHKLYKRYDAATTL